MTYLKIWWALLLVCFGFFVVYTEATATEHPLAASPEELAGWIEVFTRHAPFFAAFLFGLLIKSIWEWVKVNVLNRGSKPATKEDIDRFKKMLEDRLDAHDKNNEKDFRHIRDDIEQLRDDVKELRDDVNHIQRSNYPHHSQK